MTSAADDQGAAPVAPMDDWLRFEEIVYDEQPLPLHLRTGYERALIFPEPIRMADPPLLPGCAVVIDIDVAMFAPSEHFSTERLEFIGSESGRIYRVDVRSDAVGSRMPVRLRLR